MCNKGVWVQDIHENMMVRGFFQLDNKNPNRILKLADASGSIPILSNAELELRELINKVVWVSGIAKAGSSTLSIQLFAAVPSISWTGNPFALSHTQSNDNEDIIALANHVRSIKDDEISRLIQGVFSNASLLRNFLKAPASISHHHAWEGGLLRHTREVMDVVSPIASRLSPLDRDLVLAACLLHDVGKAFEYNYSGRWLSHRGQLLGHEISLIELLCPIANQIWSLGNPKRMMLLHLLTAKPAPKWTGIRHPRTKLVNLVRFADRWSIDSEMLKYG